jgi:16S rRNA C967 or C1407 C5-methylase (RsmB/RsmF family)
VAKRLVDKSDLRGALGPLQLMDAELDALANALSQPQPVAVRLNTLGQPCPAELLDFLADPVPWARDRMFVVRGHVRPAGRIAFATGAFFVQDAGSMLAVRLLQVRGGERVLDLCGSPGGKATAILEDLGDEPGGALLVNEPVHSRLPPLRLNLARHGGWRYVLTAEDPDELANALGAAFDAVLVDAPCTGQSLLGRGRQTRAALTQRQVQHSAARQQRILSAAAGLVRPGGRLVYSTCTFSWAENEQRIGEFLRQHADYALQPLGELAAWQSPPPAPMGCYRLWPHQHPTRGAFAARLRRREDAGAVAGRLRNRQLSRPISLDVHAWGEWMKLPKSIATDANVFAVDEDVPSAWLALIDSAPAVAQRRGESWFPAYGLAMRRDGSFRPRQTVALDEAAARRYLGGQPVPGPLRGWAVATFAGLPIGWVKGNGQVLSNHLPKSARLICEPQG